jgi:hypothetical protein
MGRDVEIAQGRDAGRLWLSMLVDAMESVARPDFAAPHCERPIPAALRLQLSQPAPNCPGSSSRFGRRN